MIKVLMFDFSRVLLHSVDPNYVGSLNTLHKELFPKDNYFIFNHFELNESLLEFLKSIKGKLELCIFTTDIIQNDPAIREKIDPVFSKIYSAAELELSKKDPKAYEFILKDLGKKPEEVLFIDDMQSNLDAAKKAGLQTHLYKDNEEVVRLIKSIFAI